MSARHKAWSGLWQRKPFWIGAAASGALILLCYGFAVRLPFFFDDLPIMTWLQRHEWLDIWTRSSENSYYRPLAFSIYKLGLLFPLGARQVVLHSISLLVYWFGAVMVMQVTRLCTSRSGQAVIAGLLFAVFPFLYLTIPWVTALVHPLVTALTLVAVYAALMAERRNAPGWWAMSLLATGVAPLAHESGTVCSLIVAGTVIIQAQRRCNRRCFLGLLGGVALNVGAMLLRDRIPGAEDVRLLGLSDWVQNGAFFLHGLLYPFGPIIGWLVREQGWHDFTLLAIVAVAWTLVLVWLARRSSDWRWITQNLWWWVWGVLPAAVSLKYGDLFIAPRLHALASAGVAMLWAATLVELGTILRSAWGRRLAWSLLIGAVLLQNVGFLNRQRDLFVSLERVYRQVLEVASEEENAPLGFINVPSWLAYRTGIYALVTEGVEFVPPYSNIGEFIQVNGGWRASNGVMFTPVLQETDQVFGFRGPGLDWQEIRRFAVDHRTVNLVSHQDHDFVLRQVGSISENAPAPAAPLVRFEGGPVIEAASAREIEDGEWAVTLTWWSAGPVSGEIFVHVRDESGSLVAQADGPALGGSVPIWLWQPADRITDIRHIKLPDGAGDYTVQAGIYDAQGRFPAFVKGNRAVDDAARVVRIER